MGLLCKERPFLFFSLEIHNHKGRREIVLKPHFIFTAAAVDDIFFLCHEGTKALRNTKCNLENSSHHRRGAEGEGVVNGILFLSNSGSLYADPVCEALIIPSYHTTL